MESMEGSGDAYEVSIGSDGKPIGEKGARGTRNYSSVVLRFGVGLLSAFAVAGASNLLVAYPLTARLEPWAVLHLTIGILLGPAGILGSVTGYFLVQALEVSSLLGVSMQAAAYLLVGTISYFVFRLVPRLDRGLSNLRSYLAFLGAAILSSFFLAVIGSASLFLRIMGKDGFWIAINYWFASSFTSLLIIAPFILIVVSWGFRRWLVPMPGEKIPAYVSGTQPAASEREIGRRARRDIAVGAALILGTTLIVCPLASLQPRNGWFALLYLVPILWGSTSRGLRGGVLAASSSGVAYLVGSTINAALISRYFGHEEILSQFAGLVIFSLVGAVTGAFQQARLRAESDLVRSNVELKKRNESLALVNSLADRLKRTLDVEMISQEAVEAFIQLSRPPLVAVYLLDDQGTSMDLKAQHGFDGEILAAGQTIPVQGSLSGLAISKLEPFVSEKISTDGRIEPTMALKLAQAGFESVVSIPMVFEKQAAGAINLVYRDQRSVAREELETFSTIGRTVALALVNARHVARLEHLALHDMLTGLPNREGLHRWFSECVLWGSGVRRKLGLVLIGIDRFKEINDALGHHVGDRLLTRIGPRIQEALAARDPLVFRLAGDEFAVIFPDLDEDEECEPLTRNLLTALAAPFDVRGMAIGIEASAGISICPDDALDSSELLRCADVAVNHAKRTSKRFVRYSHDFDQHTPERLALASDLGRAIPDNQLLLYFQPLVTLADGRPIGFEALVRWMHPKLGLIPPADFIPLAEVGELIHPLTYWVVEHALKQLKKWQRIQPDLTMSVNLSTRNLLDRSCAKKLAEIIDRTQVDPRTVEFELTETALLVDLETSSETLSKISELGARVVIDDFGTGYSSMAFIKRYRIHALKIDQSFVGDMLSDVQSRAIVRATIQLARDLNLAVVAEGIEEARIVDALIAMGCDVGQGFYFMRPSAADEVERRMEGWGLTPG